MAGIIEVKDQGKLRIYDADNSNYVDIVVPSTVSSNRTITLPDASFTVPQETNATHSGEVTGSGALTIADNIVDEANLKVSNTPTNGYMLTAQSGNTGGLTWAAAPTGFDPDAAVVFNESGADADFRIESDDNANAIFVDGGNDVVNILGTSSRNDGGLNVNVPSSVLGTNGVAQIYCRTQETDASNNATVDVFRFLDAAGNQMGSNYVNGDLYCHFGLGGNQYAVHMSVQTCGNTTGTITEIASRTRGTSLVTANPVITNDGSSGAIKIRVTFINNTGVVNNQKCVVTFVGHAV